MASGFITIHSVSRPMAVHLEWAIQGVVELVTPLNWVNQPLLPNHLRTELHWENAEAIGAILASTLASWKEVRFELTEHSLSGNFRWMYTPNFGIKHSQIDEAGNALVTENQIRHAMAESAGNLQLLQGALRMSLGQPWDDELEPFRHSEFADRTIWLQKIS
jgi:hypothetical protein